MKSQFSAESQSAFRWSPIFSSERKDLLVFVAPLIVAGWLSLHMSRFYQLYDNVLMLTMGNILLDNGHVFITYVALTRDEQIRRLNRKKIFLIPALFLLILVLLAFFQDEFGYTVLALYGLWHIVIQHRAWLLRAAKRREGFDYWLERFIYWSLVLLPSLYWFTGGLRIPASYFHENDLLLLARFTEYTFNPWLPLTLLTFGYLFYLYRQRPKPIEKIIFFSSLYLWFVGGLLLLQSVVFFFVYLIISHGLGYVTFILDGWNSVGASRQLSRKTAALSLLTIFFFAAIWLVAIRSSHFFPPVAGFLITYAPLVLHYSFDSFIWRNPRTRSKEF